MEYELRPIQEKDNIHLALVIRQSLEELGYAIDGTVYTDPNTDKMFQCYQEERSAYWIAEANGVVLGGSGISWIPGVDKTVCELQRMFLKKEARGLGIGKALMDKCVNFAKEAQYELLYLETFEHMPGARKLYERSGFEYIDEAMGKTGHFSCDVFMVKELRP